MKKLFNYRWLFTIAMLLIAISCKKHDDVIQASGVTASFQFSVDTDNYLKVTFSNYSLHYASLSWDFGDNSAVSTDENPVHTYAAAGTYTVTLTATGSDKVTSVKSQTITLTDPNVALEALTGTTSKVWKLLRDVSKGLYPLEVGPADHSAIWWASGVNESIGVRPCAFNDEYIFQLSGKKFIYETKGDIWEDTDVWAAPGGCADTANVATFKDKNGADISAWGYGVHTFDYDVTGKKLTVTGLGAFLGLPKVGSTDLVSAPQNAVTYNVIKLVDAAVDTLIVETTFPNNGTPGYWRFVLVHYDNPANEPPLPSTAGFTYAVSDHTVTFTNTSTGATSYSWNFGDGTSSTDTNPVHTYTTDGSFTVVLTASGATSSQTILIGNQVLTDALLNGGGSKAWSLKAGVGTFEVGQSPGQGNYYGGNIDLSGDRPCLFNDKFIFKTGGVYQYDAAGDVYVEDYWAQGVTNACADETTITGGAAIWISGTHTYTFTPANGTDPAAITVDGLGAFIALPKATNNGEYASAPTTDAPVTYKVLSYVSDGTTDTLTIYCDEGAGVFWTYTLTAQH